MYNTSHKFSWKSLVCFHISTFLEQTPSLVITPFPLFCASSIIPLVLWSRLWEIIQGGKGVRFKCCYYRTLGVGLAQWSSSDPPTTATRVQSWARTCGLWLVDLNLIPRLFLRVPRFPPAKKNQLSRQNLCRRACWWHVSGSEDWATTPNAATLSKPRGRGGKVAEPVPLLETT